MPILAVLDEAGHAALDDSLKTLYVQNTENKDFYLDITPDEAAKVAFTLQSQFDNKKTELTNKHKELNAIKAKYTPFEALGKTAEEIAAAIEGKQPEDVTKLVEKHRTELETITNSFKEPLEAAKLRAERLQGVVEKSLTDAAIQKVRNEYDLNETADYVLRDFIKVVPKDEGSEELVVRVFENGQPAKIAGQDMTPEMLIKGFQEAKKFPAMFNVGTGAGSGTQRQGAQFSGTTFKVDREASKTDPTLYQRAKEQADKVGGQVIFAD